MPASFVRSRLVIAGLAMAATSAGLAGCSLGNDTGLPPYTDPAVQVYDTSTHVNIASMTKVDSQLYYTDVTVGTGRTVTYGDTISTYYVGKLIGGYKFGTTARPDDPIKVPLDTVNLIKGWTLGLPGMKVGGVRRLVVGPEKGYRYVTRTDPNGFVVIPANSVLIFDVEMVAAVAKQ
jgi:peptidylprolyl isomerase